jgi:hypothetical protein
VEDTNHSEGAQSRPLQGNAHAEHAPLGIYLNDLRLNPRSLQGDGKRHAGNATTCDEEVTKHGHV